MNGGGWATVKMYAMAYIEITLFWARMNGYHMNQHLGHSEGATAWNEKGSALALQNRFDEAVSAYRRALDCEPEFIEAMLGIAHAQLALGLPHEARPYLESVLAREPGHTRAHVSLGVALYEMGDWDRAWDEFGWFYLPESSLCSRVFNRPLWEGSSLKGLRILLWTDQGLGDTLLFLRYIPVVKALGATVMVECHHPGIMPFVTRMPEVAQCVMRGSRLPAYDVHAPLIYLPSICKQCRFPLGASVPYVSVDVSLTRAWTARLKRSSHRMIGLCWQSGPGHPNARTRSVSLTQLETLADAPSTRFVGLQMPSSVGERETQVGGLIVENVLSPSCSLTDTAALMLNLDLIIAVDTMVPHLAGALGLPVWTLLRYAPSWRYWGSDEQMPWFPTMRLFRQTKNGDWAAVIERVKEALIELCVRRESGASLVR
jgi:hypothetical protein